MLKKIFMLSLALLLVLLQACNVDPEFKPIENVVKVSYPKGMISLPFKVAIDQGYFETEGIEIVFKDYSFGAARANALSKGDLDMAFTSEIPAAEIMVREPTILVLANTIINNDHIGVLARGNRDINNVSDLKGRRIGLIKGNHGLFILDTMLTFNDLSINDVDFVFLKKEELETKFREGELDAVVIWQPILDNLNEFFQDKGRIFYSKDYYSVNFLLSGNRNFVEMYPKTVERFVRALVKAEEFIANNPTYIDEKLTDWFPGKYEDAHKYGFDFGLDQSLVHLLEEQTNWLIDNSLVEGEYVRNVLDYINTEPLLNVKPGSVSIISS